MYHWQIYRHILSAFTLFALYIFVIDTYTMLHISNWLIFYCCQHICNQHISKLIKHICHWHISLTIKSIYHWQISFRLHHNCCWHIFSSPQCCVLAVLTIPLSQSNPWYSRAPTHKVHHLNLRNCIIFMYHWMVRNHGSKYLVLIFFPISPLMPLLAP